MLRLLLIAALAAGLLANAGVAEPKRVPQHSPDWTDHNQHDPGAEAGARLALDANPGPNKSAQAELQKIVVLASTEDQKKFGEEWSRYVSKHQIKGAKLDETIDWVCDQAMTERQQFMRELAERALNPVR